jgi:hypothetical protein
MKRQPRHREGRAVHSKDFKHGVAKFVGCCCAACGGNSCRCGAGLHRWGGSHF